MQTYRKNSKTNLTAVWHGWIGLAVHIYNYILYFLNPFLGGKESLLVSMRGSCTAHLAFSHPAGLIKDVSESHQHN